MALLLGADWPYSSNSAHCLLVTHCLSLLKEMACFIPVILWPSVVSRDYHLPFFQINTLPEASIYFQREKEERNRVVDKLACLSCHFNFYHILDLVLVWHVVVLIIGHVFDGWLHNFVSLSWSLV